MTLMNKGHKLFPQWTGNKQARVAEDPFSLDNQLPSKVKERSQGRITMANITRLSLKDSLPNRVDLECIIV